MSRLWWYQCRRLYSACCKAFTLNDDKIRRNCFSTTDRNELCPLKAYYNIICKTQQRHMPRFFKNLHHQNRNCGISFYALEIILLKPLWSFCHKKRSYQYKKLSSCEPFYGTIKFAEIIRASQFLFCFLQQSRINLQYTLLWNIKAQNLLRRPNTSSTTLSFLY